MMPNLTFILSFYSEAAQDELDWDDRCVQVIPNTGERADGKA